MYLMAQCSQESSVRKIKSLLHHCVSSSNVKGSVTDIRVIYNQGWKVSHLSMETTYPGRHQSGTSRGHQGNPVRRWGPVFLLAHHL